MRFSRVAALALVVATTLGGCRGDRPSSPPVKDAARVEGQVPRNSRLRDDCGGWVPAPELLDDAVSVGNAATKRDALAALDAGPLARKIDVLRAGLRLPDEDAARACAARLTYKWIDRWECARCVDLLLTDVLRPGTEADYEEFRSYLGSVELTKFLRSLPPTPWAVDPAGAILQTHRIARAVDIPAYLDLTRRGEAAIADEAWAELSLLGRWNDEFREEVARREVEVAGATVPAASADEGPGIPHVLAAWLRRTYVETAPEGEDAYRVWNEKLRWCWECTPGSRDAELLMALAQRGETNWQRIAGVAYLLLGKLADPATDAFLRAKAADGEDAAIRALARRGDRAMLEKVVDAAREHSGYGFTDFELALLMEVDPRRARVLLEELLLGPDAEAADAALGNLEDFAVPGAFYEPLGYDWRRTYFAGFGEAAIDTKIPATRLARIGIVVPGCRTRALAVAAARRMVPGDSVEAGPIAAFLETAAPHEFAEALRRLRDAHGDGAEAAERSLAAMTDPRAATDGITGSSAEGLAALLAASPDEEHGDVGAYDDPRVRGYLGRLRERREFGHYWYATGQLAAMGDPAARAEFWGAMQDGRYRIVNFTTSFERTLGGHTAATLPFWIDELRSQCCRIVLSGGEIVEDELGVEPGFFQSSWRTPYRRATELWDAAGGQFVRSRITGKWVAAPR